jgi:hypothetical protein
VTSPDRPTTTQTTMLQLQRRAGNQAVTALMRAGGTGTIRRKGDKPAKPPTEEEQEEKKQQDQANEGLIQLYAEMCKDNDADFMWMAIKNRKPEVQLGVMLRLTTRGEAEALLGQKSWRSSFFYPWVDKQGRGGLDERTRSVLLFIAGHAPDDGLLLQECVEHAFGLKIEDLETKLPPDGPSIRRLMAELESVSPGDQAAHLLIWTMVEWIRSKGGATQAFATFGQIPKAKQDEALKRILDDQVAAPVFALAPYSINFHSPLLGQLPPAKSLTELQKRFVKVAFFAKGDDLTQLTKIFEQRFALKLGRTRDTDGVAWDAPGLKRMYPALDALPAAHVERNKSLIEMNRYAPGGGIEGWYSEKRKESAIGYDTGADLENEKENTAGDPMHGKNTFDATVRHEVGHAVDETLGWSKSKAIAESRFGGWIEYGTSKSAYVRAVTDMVEKSAAGIAALPPKARKAAVKDLAETTFMDNLDDLNKIATWMRQAIDRAGCWDSLTTAQQDDAIDDPVIEALHEGRVDNDPWYEPNGGKALNGYLYERSYGFTGWYRYSVAARARKVSEYQFRHPSEWFAEAYSAYYCPVPDGTERGAVLAQSDPTAKKWFDGTVHPMKVSK